MRISGDIMGDMADFFTDDNMALSALHDSGRCGEMSGPCPYCEDDSQDYDESGPNERRKPMLDHEEPTEIAVVSQSYLPATKQAVDAVVERMGFIQALMKRAMVQGIDYGQIPGTGSKPTLLKPGAEKICVMFRLCPKYTTQKHWDGPHLTVETVCSICDLDGNELGQASSMCSTREAKYAWRKGERLCPKCGKPAIIKGKAEYGGGWVCFTKKGGCNAKFADADKSITGQSVERVENTDLADSYNTVLRIAEKRAYIAAVRLVTASSALFDEEVPDAEHVHEPEPEPAKPEPPKPAEKQMTAADKIAWFRDAISKAETPTGGRKHAYDQLAWITAKIDEQKFTPEVSKDLCYWVCMKSASVADSMARLDTLNEEVAKLKFTPEQTEKLLAAMRERHKQLEQEADIAF